VDLTSERPRCVLHAALDLGPLVAHRLHGASTPNNGPPPHVRGVINLGALRAHGRAVRLAFRVPDVPAGRYVLGIWCKPCNEHWTTALPNWQPLATGILRVRR
jgi:hypothetical protein